jgi:hypothetical protein
MNAIQTGTIKIFEVCNIIILAAVTFISGSSTNLKRRRCSRAVCTVCVRVVIQNKILIYLSKNPKSFSADKVQEKGFCLVRRNAQANISLNQHCNYQVKFRFSNEECAHDYKRKTASVSVILV